MAWSRLTSSQVSGLRAHSVVFNANVSPYAVFTDIQLPADYVPEADEPAAEAEAAQTSVATPEADAQTPDAPALAKEPAAAAAESGEAQAPGGVVIRRSKNEGDAVKA